MSKASPRRLSASRILARITVILLCLGLAVLMAFHQQIPDVAGLGLILDNLTPWLGLGIPLLLLLTIVLGGRATYVALLVPTVVWGVLFGSAALPSAPVDSQDPLVVASQNVHQDAVTSARSLAESGAEVITLQELGEGQIDLVTDALKRSHPYYYSVSTVGLWSSYPLSNPEPLDLGLGWDRALRADVDTESGPVRVYAVHAASARPTGHDERDTMLASLADYVAKDPSSKVIAAGDFNATSTDRHFAPVADQLDDVHYSAWGLAMTWPRTPFAMLGIDHVMVRGVTGTSLNRIPAGDSDHYALRASVDLAGG
ncbi:endonuclease/exonuclease/phosphatase family protein [Glutamicibacter soli]|uniref:endonuclease/exonuclease/phosphatase family protein n=1 Tax=Glutamicibacter soli TaxID=453836 RepID=UPI0011BD7C3B|nr:endonuclease/exonuclease/phosphatase family protein [Glutamicibacter soli]